MQTSCAHLALVVALLASMPLAARADDEDVPTNRLGRVRAADPRVEALIVAGSERSTTLRELIARLSRTRWLVFVQRARCPDAFRYQGAREWLAGPPACLIGRVGAYEGAPYLLVRIDPRHFRTPNEEIALISHELQHALEAAEAPDVIDSQTLTAFFRRNAKVAFQEPGVTGYETVAARQIDSQVMAELRRQPPRAEATGRASGPSDRPHLTP